MALTRLLSIKWHHSCQGMSDSVSLPAASLYAQPFFCRQWLQQVTTAYPEQGCYAGSSLLWRMSLTAPPCCTKAFYQEHSQSGNSGLCCVATDALQAVVLWNAVLLLQFLTNVFFIPYMALRQFSGRRKPNMAPSGCDVERLPSYSSALGQVAAAVGTVTLFWIPLAQPEFGNLADR